MSTETWKRIHSNYNPSPDYSQVPPLAQQAATQHVINHRIQQARWDEFQRWLKEHYGTTD
jgi:hypothetical protein